ncbi:hypothetical protein ACFL5K_03105 [Gemmatimonadota bacterium]
MARTFFWGRDVVFPLANIRNNDGGLFLDFYAQRHKVTLVVLE